MKASRQMVLLDQPPTRFLNENPLVPGLSLHLVVSAPIKLTTASSRTAIGGHQIISRHLQKSLFFEEFETLRFQLRLCMFH